MLEYPLKGAHPRDAFALQVRTFLSFCVHLHVWLGYENKYMCVHYGSGATKLP